MKKLLFILFSIFLSVNIGFANNSFDLSKEEKLWLEKKHKVKVRVANWPPFMINKDNNFQGISIEYIKKIFDKHGIEYEFVHSSKYPWKKALNSIKNKDGVDLLPVIKKTPTRAKDMIFTSDYISSPQVIFTRNNSTFISNLNDLNGKTVAVEESYVMHETLKKWYSNINLKVISGLNLTQTALEELAIGNVDAYVGNLTTASYIIKSLQLNNIKVASPTDFPNHDMSMGIRDDWKELASIINKELKLISNEDKNRIYNKYFSIKYEYGVNETDIFKWVMLAILFLSPIVIIVYIKNKKINSKQKLLEIRNEELLEAQNIGKFGVWNLDLLNNKLEWSDEIYNIFEIDKDKFQASYEAFLNAIHPDDRDKVNEAYNNSLKDKLPYEIKHRLLMNDGRVKWVLEKCKTTFDKNGNALHSIGIVQDISIEEEQRSIISDQAIQLKKQHETLSEHVIYSRTSRDGFFTDISQAFCNISGFSKDELIGRHYEVIKHPEMTKTTYDSIHACLKNGQSWRGELKNLKKDGSYFWVFCDISPEYNSKGEWIGFISIRSDITAKKDFERQHLQLVEHAKLASMGEMIGNIAHQWRQPLNAISLAISSVHLQYEIGTLTKEEMSKFHNLILNNTNHLSETIDTFRDFIKNEKSYQLLKIEDEINKAIHIAKASLRDRHITFENNIDENGVTLVKTVSGELPQVLINIFNNAQDILGEKKIEKPWIKLEMKEEEDKVIITIEDNAGGVPDDVLPHVFEPYFTTKHKSKGTGLGLHMSYKIVSESLKGEIYVKNTVNGAKFFIELPLEQKDISEL